MAHVIAVAGKGGVGKTTLCGMLIQYLCEQGKGPVLAVDADANSNLNEVLGVKVDTTLGDRAGGDGEGESDPGRNVQGGLRGTPFRGRSRGR